MRSVVSRSDETHPFPSRQYISVGITTKEYSESIPLTDAFVDGELTRESFVPPWAVVSLRDSQVERAVARISEPITDRATQQMAAFAGHRSSDKLYLSTITVECVKTGRRELPE